MLAILAPLLALLFRWVIEERLGVIIASAFALHTAWHWFTDRAATLTEYDWSLSDPATLARLLRVLMVVVAVPAASGWILRARGAGVRSTHTENPRIGTENTEYLAKDSSEL